MTIKRRDVLGGLATTGAIAWVSGPAGAIPVAGFDRPVEVLGGSEADDAASGYARLFEVGASARTGIFTLGVASGDPRPNGVVLWTRVDPRNVSVSAGRARVMFQIATGRDFAGGTIVMSGMAQTSAARDWTVKLPVQNSRLQPFTRYYYRFIADGAASPTGRFKTLPLPDQSVGRIRLGFCSCQDFSNGYYTAFAKLAEEELDLVCHLGDYIYEERDDPTFQGQQVRQVPAFPSGNRIASSLADYRHLYRTYRADPDLQAAHHRFAFVQVWDDHEFANDCWGVTRPDDTASGEPDRQPGLRAAANQAWAEYVPAEVPAPSGPSLEIYRSRKLGRLAELFATDERLYRSGPPCGRTTLDRYATAGCPALEDDSRTMLGREQRDWFVRGVSRSTSTWKLWLNEVMVMPLRVVNTFGAGRDVFLNLDAWDGFPAERSAILGRFFEEGEKNLIAVTGDIHSFGAGYLKRSYDGLEGAAARAGAVGVEFVGGSITSSNLLELITGAAAGTGLPVPAEVVARIAEVLGTGGVDPSTLLVAQNPHLRYFSSSSHGYGIVELTPTQATCELRAVTTVRERQAGVRTLRTFRVPVDSATLIG